MNSTLSKYFGVVAVLTLIGEVCLNLFIIKKVPYTEIDWIAYMQETGGFLSGDWNYLHLRGDTGPCVYPAGFLYIFSVLRLVTENGRNILLGQYIFAAIYCALIAVLLLIYRRVMKDNNSDKSDKYMPVIWTILLLCISRRIHSIFVLRLFNDGVAMLFLYLAIAAFIYDHWSIGSILFSVALSIKMNILLFLPGLLVLYVKRFGFIRSFTQIFLIVAIQAIFAIPFLMTNSAGYMERAFNFGREFTYIWTVNYKFLTPEQFVSKALAKSLLVSHAAVLIFMGFFRWTREEGGPFKLIFKGTGSNKLTAQHIVKLMFESNFVGIVFARSLHFQFYVWYYHTLPFLLFSMNIPLVIRLCVMAAVEVIWNVFPSNATTSAALMVIHALLLIGVLFVTPYQSAYRTESKEKRKKD